MTVVAQFVFPAGRYHATPWGRHVNEGAIEWPPSPWRLLRALIAVGFNRLGWPAVPGDAARMLERLASQPPRYLLPPAGSAHSRHYMPLYREKTTKVIDTFAVVGADSPLYVAWGVELPANERALLGQLLEAMSYLGRAESWVEAKLVPTEPEGPWTRAAPGPPTDGGEWERVDLLTPLSNEHFADWRGEAQRSGLASALELAREEARAKDKKPPEELTRKRREEVEARYPATLVDALMADTSTLQREGWSIPPGTRWSSYWRPPHALQQLPTARTTMRSAKKIDAILYAVTSATKGGNTLPPLQEALRRGEAIHDALVRLASTTSADPVQLSGQLDGQPMKGHRHPFVLPVSRQFSRREFAPGRARIDHVLVCVPPEVGFDETSMRALLRLEKTYARGVSALWLTPVWSGTASEADRDNLPWLVSSSIWETHTPFVAPRHLKPRGKNSLAGQISAELAERGLPPPQRIELSVDLGGAKRAWVDEHEFWVLWRNPRADRRLDGRWRAFRRERQTPRPHIASQPALALRLTFSRELEGPIALGYGCHQGLGLFSASRDV